LLFLSRHKKSGREPNVSTDEKSIKVRGIKFPGEAHGLFNQVSKKNASSLFGMGSFIGIFKDIIEVMPVRDIKISK